MAAKETKVYPVKGRTLAGVPASVHIVPTRAEADELVASGAFTLNAHDAERDPDAADLSGDGPITHESVRYLGESPPGETPAPNDEGPPQGGSSDSSQET
jgi:hypothetical protein